MKKNRTVKFLIRKDIEEYVKKIKGWSLNDVCAETGHLKQQVSPYLRGKKEPSLNFLHRFCEVTGFNLEDIIVTVR